MTIDSQIGKRLALNLLTQGAAAHTYVSASHLVRNELDRLRPNLTLLYDRAAIGLQLNYCIGDNALLFGRPNRFFGYSNTPQRAFQSHPFLAKYANQLASEELARLKPLARAKGVRTTPFLHWLQFTRIMHQTLNAEQGLQTQLQQLAVRAAAEMWDFDTTRLDGEITREVAFGNLQRPRTRLGRLCRLGAVGYSGVRREGSQFRVIAKAWVFPLLMHELVKGIVELISLHGLGDLDDATYAAVTNEADQLEYEAWLLQAGPAMWRRLLAVAPREQKLATTVMLLARLSPARLDDVLTAVIEQPNQATEMLADLSF